jgi:hypothetical protein
MRRSICVCEPAFAYAGHNYNWKFIYTSAVNLPKGALLKFDLDSAGREIDWEIPQTNLKKPSNLIYMKMPGGKIIGADEVEDPDGGITPQFEFELPVEVKSGKKITFVIGSLETAKHTKTLVGNTSQLFSQRRRSFWLCVDPKGKGKYSDPEEFCIDVRGNILENIKIVSPSIVFKNKKNDVILRFEDQYGNLTSQASSETLIDLTYENFRENLKWQLFVPETGFLVLPNLYFNEAGVYRIKLNNSRTGKEYISAPIKCFDGEGESLYWGLLHGESERVDSAEDIENCLRHMRDEKSLNFFASSSFENAEETSNNIWKLISQHIADFNENDRFNGVLGFQWVGEDKKEGVRHFLFSKDGKGILRKKDAKNNSLKRIYKNSLPKDLLAIPSLSMGKGHSYDFKDYSPEFEPVVEIYNAWGSSECTKKEGNITPIKGAGKGCIKEAAEGSIRTALNNNCRFGFVAGGLDDRGIYAGCFDGDQEQYPPGHTAIFAKSLSRDALWTALRERSCYATTGARILVGFFLAGIHMGKEVSTIDKPGLVVNRHISGYVVGTSNIKKIEIIRNGKVLKTFKPDVNDYEYTFDDMEPIAKALIKPKNGEPFLYYYLKVVQEDGHVAWSSPIWVDYIKIAKKK